MASPNRSKSFVRNRCKTISDDVIEWNVKVKWHFDVLCLCHFIHWAAVVVVLLTVNKYVFEVNKPSDRYNRLEVRWRHVTMTILRFYVCIFIVANTHTHASRIQFQWANCFCCCRCCCNCVLIFGLKHVIDFINNNDCRFSWPRARGWCHCSALLSQPLPHGDTWNGWIWMNCTMDEGQKSEHSHCICSTAIDTRGEIAKSQFTIESKQVENWPRNVCVHESLFVRLI